MGLLTEDIMEQDFVVVGSFYDVYIPSISYENTVFDMNYWGAPLKGDISNLPTILDSKNRIRIDPDALIQLLLDKFVRPQFRRIISDHNPQVSVSSTGDSVFYAVNLKDVLQIKSREIWTPQISRIGCINLRKIP